MNNRACSFLTGTFSCLLIVFSCLMLLNACADVEPEEVKFKVIGYSNNFEGLYTIDSEEDQSFVGVNIGSNIYKFEKTIEVEDQLEIEASPDTTTDALTSLEIKVYRDNVLIKTVQDISDPVEKISLIYTSGEAAETTD